MLRWDNLFIEKCEELGINLMMYSRFKDDIFVAANAIEKGSRLENGKLIVDMNKKLEDEGKNDDTITMEIIRQVAEMMDPIVKLTIDVPSNHENMKIAVLDLNINLNKHEGDRIDYEFFEKATKNPKTLLAESAINSGTKRTILTQECLRRIRNTKIELGEPVLNEHLNRFMLTMKNSGWNQNYRTQILKSAFNAFEKMVEEDKNGSKPLYRKRSWNMAKRLNDKESKKKNWYKMAKNSENSYQSILFVPPTPGSVLLKELKSRQKELNKDDKDQIKMVEKGGVKIKQILTNKYPFKNEKCKEKWCPLCKGDYGDFKVACNTKNAGYRWTCKTCQETKNETKAYEGESSRSIRIRSKEHIAGYRNKKLNNFLYKHKTLEHINEEVEYKLEITGIFKDALTRQANESVRIYKRPDAENLNSKSEFNHPPTARVMVESKKKK